jgi:hypothetical protein
MNIFGGIQEKIKIINVVKNITDILYTNEFELEIKYEGYPLSDYFIKIAKSLQKISFIYESISVTPTILLRNLLYNPTTIPIIANKTCKECIYTRTPIRKNIAYESDTKNILSIPPEESVFIIDINIDNKKQNTIIDDVRTKFLIPENIDSDNKLLGINDKIFIMLKQLQYVVHMMNITNGFYLIPKSIIDKYIPKKDTIILSWYTKKEIELLRFLLKEDSYIWTYNLYPIEKLYNDFDLFLYGLTEGTNLTVKRYFIDKEIENNRRIELQKINYNIIKENNKKQRYNVIIKKFGFNSKKLTKDQEKVINAEYNRQEKYSKELHNNKCEHIRLYKQLISYSPLKNESNLSIILTRLSEFFSKDQVDGFIYCSVCKFPIMCSHVYDKLKNKVADLMNYAITNTNKNSEYYCKYCGERLYQYADIDVTIRNKNAIIYSDVEIEIRNYTWSVSMNILQQISTDSYCNEKKIASYIISDLMSLLSSKINTFEDKSKIIIIMHVYSYILHIMKTQHISFLNVDTTLPVSKIAEKLLLFAYKKYNTLFKKLNMDTIKSSFISAYKDIFMINANIPVSNMEEDLAQFIYMVDPVYKYARVICRLNNKNLIEKKSLKINNKKEFELIIGKSLSDIIKIAKINNKNPMYSDIINKRFGSILQLKSLEYFYRSKELNFYNNLINIDNSKEIIKNFLQTGENYYLVSYILVQKYLSEIHNEEEFDKYIELFKKIENKRKELSNKESLITTRSTLYAINYKKQAWQLIEPIIIITKLYDENGKKHKWNKFIYDTTNTNKQNIIDVECSVCNYKKSEINKLDINKTWNAVNASTDIKSLYMFYTIRCPKGDIHIWKNDTCTKCLLTTNMMELVIVQDFNNDIISYYNKFKQTFIDEKKNFMIEYKKQKINKEEIKIEWKYDYTTIVKVAELTNTNINIITSIGQTEGRKYKDIIDGVGIPDKMEINHIYSAYSELLYLISSYFESVNKKDISNYPYIFTNMIENNNELESIHNFIIQSICEIILQTSINDKELALKLFNKIITNQKLFALPTNFNWKAIDDEINENIVYLGDDIGDSGEDLIVENQIMSSHGTDDIYYSSKNIDYDFSEDNPNNELHIDYKNEYIYW